MILTQVGSLPCWVSRAVCRFVVVYSHVGHITVMRPFDHQQTVTCWVKNRSAHPLGQGHIVLGYLPGITQGEQLSSGAENQAIMQWVKTRANDSKRRHVRGALNGMAGAQMAVRRVGGIEFFVVSCRQQAHGTLVVLEGV